MSVSHQSAPVSALIDTRLSARLGRGLSRWWRGYMTWRSRQLAAAALRQLDDRMLRDIGIDRSEINSVVYAGGRGRTGRYAGTMNSR